MAKRKYNIRWSEADEKELQRVVKNFNAKIARLEKKIDPKDTNPVLLPERVKVSVLRDMIQTRQDLNRELNALKRFSKKGAEAETFIPDNYYNIKITKWQMKEMNRRAAIINRNREQRRKEVENMDAYSRQQKLSYTVGHTMSDEEKAALQPINVFTTFQGKADLRQKMRTLQKQSMVEYWKGRDEALRRGYIRAMTENLGTTAEVMKIVDAINNMDVGEFRRKFQEEQSKFSLAYPGDQDKVKENIKALRAIWMPEKADADDMPLMDEGIIINADEDDDFPW